MKPIQLRMEAFGPYSNIVDIDFSRLGESGLFLVSGDTGSGKTTIFDGICYALFGETSGQTRSKNDIISDFAEQKVKAHVSLDFSHKGKVYNINRTIRRKASGDIDDNKVSFTYDDGTLVTGKTAVKDAVNKLLGGMEFNQFKQICMIAQGEFTKLLHSNVSDRNKILKQIFNTDIYSKFTTILQEKEKEYKQKCEELKYSLFQYMNGIKLVEDSEYKEELKQLIESKNANLSDDVLHILETINEEDTVFLESFQSKKGTLLIEFEELISVEERAKRKNELIVSILACEAKLTELKSQEDDMKNYEIQFHRGMKALSIYNREEHRYMDKVNLLDALKNKIKLQNEEMYRLEIERNLRIVNLKEEEDKGEERKQLTHYIHNLESKLSLYQELSSCTLKLEIANKNLFHMEEDIMKYTDLRAKVQEEMERLEQFILERKDITTHLIAKNSMLDSEVQLEKKLETRKKYIDKLLNTLDEIDKEELRYKQVEEEYEISNEVFLNKEKLFLREQAGFLAQELKDHQPCPVCGSCDHPMKATYSGEAPSKEELNRMKDKKESLYKALSDRSNQLGVIRGSLKSEINQLKVDDQSFIDDISREYIKGYKDLNNNKMIEVRDKISELTNHIKGLEEENTKLNSYMDMLDKRKKYEYNLSKELEFKKEEKSKIYSELVENKTKVDNYKKDLEYETEEKAKEVLSSSMESLENKNKAYNEAVDAYHSMENRLASSRELYKTYCEESLEKEEEVKILKLDLDKSIVEANFANMEDYKNALLSEKRLEELNRKIDSYSKEIQRNEDMIITLSKDIEDKSLVDVDDIIQKKNAMNDMMKNIDNNSREVDTRLSSNKDTAKNIKKVKKELDKELLLYTEVKTLSNTASGQVSQKEKLSFQTFVQRYYFLQIIDEANKRFYHMTSKRYRLLQGEPESKQAQTGLEIDVIDTWTGKIRSVKSLSGGETFMAALSLALGFSDVIQRFAGAIEIDAMFIDEGFGTLDGEALEEAINTLSDLTMGNRMVGIISHVDELKTRIDKQIIVKKDMTGSYISRVGY